MSLKIIKVEREFMLLSIKQIQKCLVNGIINSFCVLSN
jgi:hypothetical protein